MKQFLTLLSMLLLCLLSLELAAQSELEIKDLNGNVLLEVRKEGLVIKKVSTTERTGYALAAADRGLLVYDTDLSAFFTWNGVQWVQIDGTDLVDDADADPANELQTISYDPATKILTLSNGGTVDLSSLDNATAAATAQAAIDAHIAADQDLDPANELQDISLSGYQLSITNGSTVDLTSFGIDTDDQTLSLTGSELSISEGNTVDLSNIDINLSGSDLAPLECNALAGKLTRNVLFRDVAASGNYAYLISGSSQDLKIVDISIPSAPTVTGTLPGMTVLPTSIAVNGNYAYVTRAGTEQDLAVIDISDPTAPALVGSTPNLGLYPNDVVVRDNYAYMASGGIGGFRVVDVSTPATPTIIGIVSGIGGTFLTISGDYAYLSDYVQSQLHIVNIANPAAPSLVSTTPLGYQPEAIAVRGSYVYINDVTNNELKIIDVSDPNAPNPIGSFPGGGTSSDIAVVDDLAYYITYDPVSGGQYVGKLRILDLSNPANPSVLKTITDTPNGFRLPYRLAVTDQFAFVVDLNFSPGALFIFELCPQNIGFGLNPYTDEIVLTTPNYQDLSLSGNTLSLSNDGTPVDLSGFLDNTDNQDLSLSGNTLSLTNDGTPVDLSGFMDSPWQKNGSNIYRQGGRVGVGINAPRTKLDVVSDEGLYTGALTIQNTNTSGTARINFPDYNGQLKAWMGWVNSTASILAGTGTMEIGVGSTNSTYIRLNPGNGNISVNSSTTTINSSTAYISGKVGIGITNPTRAKLEISGSVPFDPPGNIGYLNSAGETGSYDPFDWPYSIYASNVISGQEFHAHSDARIKNILGVSDSRSDLKTLLQIEITDYRMRDTLAHGSRATKKVIAQQVEKVYPQAVTAGITEVVPDIYQRAIAEENWVMLATDLKVSERVKLITEKASSIYTVTAVEAGRFQVELPSDAGPLSSTVFVYGREVNDFHTVDYEAISMLNVSATQELAKQVERLKAENEALRAENAAFEARLARMEAMLYSGQSGSNATNTAK